MGYTDRFGIVQLSAGVLAVHLVKLGEADTEKTDKISATLN